MKIYCIDIDGTICTNTNGAYETAQPYLDRIARLNALFDEGHTLIYFTARGGQTGVDWSTVTKNQFSAWGVKYHELLFGKPHADIYIDDKAMSDQDWFSS